MERDPFSVFKGIFFGTIRSNKFLLTRVNRPMCCSLFEVNRASAVFVLQISSQGGLGCLESSQTYFNKSFKTTKKGHQDHSHLEAFLVKATWPYRFRCR